MNEFEPRAPEKTPREAITISEYIELLNTRLLDYATKLIGEVSQCTVSLNGHAYFTLKDKEDGSVLHCVMWKTQYRIHGVHLEEGIEVMINGYPTIYGPTGKLSFIAETLEPCGEGALKRAYEKLKNELEGEGIFAPERKSALPQYPHTVGVITSREGAVIHDFINNLGRHGFRIKLAHSAVEGQEALIPLLKALRVLKNEKLDVLAVMRGGGSLESFQAFNNEALVREIARFPVPVVVGLGHHKDVPLAALAADYMCSTPTAVAHLLNRSWDELLLKIERLERTTFDGYASVLFDWSAHFKETARSVPDVFARRLQEFSRTIELIQKTILLNDPARQLRLGFSITRRKGKIVRRKQEVSPRDTLEIQLKDGIINAEAK